MKLPKFLTGTFLNANMMSKFETPCIFVELTSFILAGYFIRINILFATMFLCIGLVVGTIAGEMIKNSGRIENQREVLHQWIDNQPKV